MEFEELQAVYEALDRVQAIAEFDLDGTIRAANQNFLSIFGYNISEIKGQHHRIFCEEAIAQSNAYSKFWQRLNQGEPLADEFKRISKEGDEIWLQASYTPVMDNSGKTTKIIKFATDITDNKRKDTEYEGKVAAINRSQAVIEFELDGTVITANDNFLEIFGYQSEDVQGQHHKIFCHSHYSTGNEYDNFWRRLSSGEYVSGEFKRKSKDGREIWLQASYNPMLDTDGKPYKIVKFALDITDDVHQRNLAILEMSTPVTNIWEGVLFVPIVGIVDSKRSVDIMSKALTSISDTQARSLMLDISGVAVVDTAVANHLIKIAKAAVLMGCKTIISGISPSIAQTITELGVDMGSIQTTSTIAAALRDSIDNDC